MKSAATSLNLPWLGRILGVHREPLTLTEPFEQVVRRFAHLPGTVALMSGGELDCARYHILGVHPWLSLRGWRTRTTIADGERSVGLEADPFTTLQHVLAHFARPGIDSTLPLSAGLLGYFAYDLKDCLEDLPRTSVDEQQLPLSYLVAPAVLVIHDKLSGETTLLVPRRQGKEAAASRALARFKRALAEPLPGGRHVPQKAGKCASVFSRGEYLEAVEVIRRYIVDGDVYQVNMSQRFQAPFSGDVFDCFTTMYAANPAPFFAYVNAGDHQIVSTSPERFLSLRGGRVETRPIKGTRPRGETPAVDQAMRRELEESAKENAELSMIVDLMRNDIGKVCRAGSVRVAEHKRLEAYQNVYHLVSIVEGELDPGRGAVDLLRATFPGGSITGCPKIRAMEIIDELEPVRRHLYTGSIGYLGFGGTMDLSIAIRTATFAGGKVAFSVGGGIVYDSDPASEFEETLHKGRTLSSALQAAGTDEAPPAIVWHDGAFKPIHSARVGLDCGGLMHGRGIFETLRVQAGRPVLLEAHRQRFDRAFRELLGGEPPDVTWAEVIAQLIAKNGLSSDVAAVKLVAAGSSPGDARPYVLFASARPYRPRAPLAEHGGLRLAVYPHRRHMHLASHKTLSYLFYELAGNWAKSQGADEALILNVDGSVSETNTANVLCVFGKTVCFPLSAHALPGTMAAEARRWLLHRGFSVEDRRVSVEELRNADQVLLTNSLMGAAAVVVIDGAPMRREGGLCEAINQGVFGPSTGDAAAQHDPTQALGVEPRRAAPSGYTSVLSPTRSNCA